MTQSKPALRTLLLRVLPLTAALCLFLITTLPGTAAPLDPTAAPAANKYIGSKKCKNCHDAEASGDQWGFWLEEGHASAFEVLKSDEAKKIAKELGIKDASKSDKCLKCHDTGFGIDKKLLKKSFKHDGGVGCETCHGPGDKHARARFRAANEEEDEEEGFGDEEEAATYTEIPAGEIGMDITRELCVKCHNNESPTYKPFCFYLRVEKVRHLNPLKPRTPEQLAAMLVCGCGEDCKCDHDCTEGCGVPPKK